MRPSHCVGAMRTTVVIPVYNNAGLIGETLETVYAQDLDPSEFEIIVVDDGSTDGTPHVLAHHSERIRSIRQDNSGGCSRPRNRGIAAARGEYIAVFDSDDLMSVDKIRLQAEFLDRHADVDLVFTDFVDFRGAHEFRPHTRTCQRFRSVLRRFRVGVGEYVLDSETAYGILLDENFIGASSMFFRRSLVDQVGGFDEAFLSSEDREFTFRVTRERRVGFIDRIGHRRRLHSGSMSSRSEKMLDYKIRLYTLERSRTSPELRPLVERRLGELHGMMAYFLRESGRIEEAASHYGRAMIFRPWALRTYTGFGRCLLRSMQTRVG